MEADQDNKSSCLRRGLSYLVFQAPGLRIGLELSCCIFLFHLLATILSSLQGTWAAENLHVFAWFLACITIALIDYFLFGTPVRAFRDSYHLQQRGREEEALSLLQTIAPDSGALVPCPEQLYFSRSAEILIAAKKYAKAHKTIEQIPDSTSVAPLKALLQAKLIESKNSAAEALSFLEESGPLDPLINFEKALLMLKAKISHGETRAAFEAVIEGEDSIHPSGESLNNLSHAFIEVKRLWTGHAEDAIQELSVYITVFQGAAVSLPGLRELLAILYVERAYYFATHSEPSAALNDLSVASALSNCVYVQQRREESEEELLWRYDIKPTEAEKTVSIGGIMAVDKKELRT